MAEEEKKDDGAPAEKKGGAMKLIIIINALVLLLVLGGVGLFFMLKDGGKHDAEVLADEPAAGEEGAAEDAGHTKTPIYIPMTPQFVVNLENQEQVSFLQVEMEAMTYDAKVDDAMKAHSSRIRSEILMLLGSKQYHEISNIEGKRKLSQEVIDIIQNVIKETGVSGNVEAVYFTSFVMQ